jgi:uncharacterized protein
MPSASGRASPRPGASLSRSSTGGGAANVGRHRAAGVAIEPLDEAEEEGEGSSFGSPRGGDASPRADSPRGSGSGEPDGGSPDDDGPEGGAGAIAAEASVAEQGSTQLGAELSQLSLMTDREGGGGDGTARGGGDGTARSGGADGDTPATPSALALSRRRAASPRPADALPCSLDVHAARGGAPPNAFSRTAHLEDDPVARYFAELTAERAAVAAEADDAAIEAAAHARAGDTRAIAAAAKSASETVGAGWFSRAERMEGTLLTAGGINAAPPDPVAEAAAAAAAAAAEEPLSPLELEQREVTRAFEARLNAEQRERRER